MIMFTINNLSKTYGNDYIIINGKIVINTHDKCALVGKNGSGKTTIMNIINGNTDYEGNLEKNDITICKFNQIEEIQDTAQNYLIDYQNYDYEKENIIHQLIDMFELDSNILLKQFNTLSGGQKSIIRLIKTLSSKSDLLLLDEPTNHLDFKSINILINWLKKFEKSYVIISHDRFFLNEISNKVIEIENKLINSYNCNYDEYIKRKKKRIENEEENYQKNIKEKKRLNTIKQEQDKFKNKLNTKLSKLKLIHGPNKAAACSARQKGEKSQIRYGKNISVTDQKIENLNLIKPNIDNNRLRIELFQTNKSNYEVIELDECSKSIEDNLILNKINLEILRNDKIFISGNSGSGKTTLINSIINKKFDNGNLKLGDNIIIGQISQEKFHLQKEIKIIDYFKKKYSKIDLITS